MTLMRWHDTAIKELVTDGNLDCTDEGIVSRSWLNSPPLTALLGCDNQSNVRF